MLACVPLGCYQSGPGPDVVGDAPADAADARDGPEAVDEAGVAEEGRSEGEDAVEDEVEEEGSVDEAGGPGDGGDADGAPVEGAVADFVIDSLRIGDDTLGEGFNLDGVDTPPRHPYLPEDGPGGVDNGFGSLVRTLIDVGVDIDVDSEIAVAIAEGRQLTLLRHRDVDDWRADPDGVSLYAYAGHDADGNPANNLAGDAEMLADERSLVDPADIWSASSVFVDGALVDTAAADGLLQEGDFEAGPGTLVLLLAFGADQFLELPLRGALLVWDLGVAPAGDPPVGGRVVNGLLGGHMLIQDAVRAFAALDFAGTSLDLDTIRTVMAGQADMDVLPEGFTGDPCTEATARDDCTPGQTCEPDPDRGGDWYCFEQPENPDALSVGFVFTAVSCRITGVWDDPAWP
jgi:hypothetical protein